MRHNVHDVLSKFVSYNSKKFQIDVFLYDLKLYPHS